MKDVNDEYIYKYPSLYAAGQKGVYFSFRTFWKWLLFAMYHGVVIYFGTVYVSFNILNL